MASWVKYKASVGTNSCRAPWKHQTRIRLKTYPTKKRHRSWEVAVSYIFFLWLLSLFESWFIVPAVLIVWMLMRLDAGWYLSQENTPSLLKTKHLRHRLRFPDSEHFVFIHAHKDLASKDRFEGCKKKKNTTGGYLGQKKNPNNKSKTTGHVKAGFSFFRLGCTSFERREVKILQD